ncbi:MAG: transcription factor E [Methanobacteriaceae archaeon]|jgi:transcription initiation factor TFIIE subunit alpha|nr:transcription factor E [Methanobacteriaceae archaeon]
MLNDPLAINLLTDVVENEENLSIVKCLIDGTTTDEEIAEKTEIRLNIVRKILYKLHDEGLASYKRSKDPETQWYTYDWVFENEEVEKQLKMKSNKMLDNLNNMLQKEENNMFFVCPDGDVRFDFETASNLDFMCPECGDEVKFEENTEIIKKIKEDIQICEKAYQSSGSSK